jgi:polar amino acid transport system substrate-binding protein
MRRLVPFLACLAVLQAATALAEGGGPPLRVCADPDNLPFTGRAPDRPGLYLELAQRIADQLGRRMEPVWTPSYRAKRMIRTALLGHQCDMLIGVPAEVGFMAPRLLVSDPVVDVGYVLVTPPGGHVADAAGLRGLRVAVAFDTPGQDYLAERDDVTPVTVLTSKEGVEAIAQHRADAALLWGPEAGYLNKTRMDGAYAITPLQGEHLQWQVGIAVAGRDQELRGRINAALGEDRGFIQGLASKYGFPGPATDGRDAKPTLVAQTDAASVAAPSAAASSVAAEAVAPPTTAAGPGTDGELPKQGRAIFNSMCFHCHGTNAVTATERQNLRHLRHRYGDAMDQTFLTTVTNGRPTKGMPAWKDVYTEDDFKALLSFLHTVQEP